MSAWEDALKRREPKYPYRPIPPMEEIIRKLYDEPPEVKYSEIVGYVRHPEDRTIRFTVYKDSEGKYKCVYDKLVVESEEFWDYICRIDESRYPGYWDSFDITWPDCISFDTAEEAYEQIRTSYFYEENF